MPVLEHDFEEFRAQGQQGVFVSEDKKSMRVDISRARGFIGLENLVSPYEFLERIIKEAN
jgi:hypothetical protein